MFDILTLNKISNKIYDVLTDDYSVSDKTESPDAILVRSFKMDEYEINDNLLCVARAGAGVNNIPLDKMTDAGVCVFNTPGANANAVKELVICGMFLASRDIIGGNKWANTLTGADVPKQVEKGKSNFGGTEILGKTVGIIGLGAIGIKVANALNALGMKVVGYDPFYKGNEDYLSVVNTLEEIYATSDYISLHLPLLPTTRGMINADAIAKMKDGVIILNMARGELVDVSAVKSALENGKIRNYVVDFPSEDCLNVNGIIAIPHLGASTEEAEENCAIMASAQIKEYLENGNIINSVNFPNIKVQKEKENRLTVIYNAGTKALEEIKSAVSGIDANFNFAERNTIGYAIIDTDNSISLDADENLVATIADLDDVVGIRIL